LSLLEVPMQILNAYRLRPSQHRQNSQGMEMYRQSPRSSPYMTATMPQSSSDMSLQPSYSHSPVHGTGLPIPGTSYYGNLPNPNNMRRETMSSISSLVRSNSYGDRTMSAGSSNSMGMVYGSPQQQPRSSHEVLGSRLDYFEQAPTPYNPYGLDMNARFVTPSQLWA
jgi:hypothetical protein